jgi:hypothetical protein
MRRYYYSPDAPKYQPFFSGTCTCVSGEGSNGGTGGVEGGAGDGGDAGGR